MFLLACTPAKPSTFSSAHYRPPNFEGNHHQARPTVSLSKFGLGALFPCAGLGHGNPIPGCALPAPSVRTGDTIMVPIAS